MGLALIRSTPLVLLLATVLAGCSDDGPAGEVRVEFVTSLGNFTVETDSEHAPVTVANFLAYVDSGYYVNLTFHRVAPGFVVQGGGFESDYQTRHQARPPIVLEATPEERNVQWSLSMARTGEPNSATSEFFVNLVDNTNLDSRGPGTGYAVFAHVVDGFETITAMTQVEPGQPFSAGGFYPKVPIVIHAAMRVA